MFNGLLKQGMRGIDGWPHISKVISFFLLINNLNTALASCGLILYDSQTEKEVWSGSKFYSTGESAQAAEVKALLAALTALSDVGMKKLIVQGHAGGTTIQQLQGNFGVKSKSVKDMVGKIKVIMEKNFDDCEVWGITMDQISKVRSVSKKALSTRSSEGFVLLQLPQLGKKDHGINDIHRSSQHRNVTQ